MTSHQLDYLISKQQGVSYTLIFQTLFPYINILQTFHPANVADDHTNLLNLFIDTKLKRILADYHLTILKVP